MFRQFLTMTCLAVGGSLSIGCGLNWTLPQAHFDGVEEHGYVAYWEKIGEVNLGDGLVMPINIGFNSHRESSSPALGKGWIVALLESHVEPVDENSMHVIMPDGWTFIFLRNGSSETWRGNSGWVGETNNTIFTITAPCGWKIKYDGGKIQEIESNKNRILSYKYNGPVATEVDIDNEAFVKLESNSTTGVTEDILIGSQKINIASAQRPRVQAALKQNLITGFDRSLNQLQWPDGKRESFAFGADKSLNPTLAITHADKTQRNFTWDPTTRQIKTDGEWIYHLTPGDNVALNRSNGQGQLESYENNPATGTTIETGIDGFETKVTRFVGPTRLSGHIKTIESRMSGKLIEVDHFSYNEKGNEIRFSKRDGNGTLLLQIDKIPAGPNLCQIIYTTPRATQTLEVPYDSGS